MWFFCMEIDKVMCHIALKLSYKYPAKLDGVMLCGTPHVLVVENKASSRIPTEGGIQFMKPHNHGSYVPGFLSAFWPRGRGKMRLYGLLGRQVCIHVQSMWQTRGVWGHAPPGNFDFGSFIRCNLVESGTVFAQT